MKKITKMKIKIKINNKQNKIIIKNTKKKNLKQTFKILQFIDTIKMILQLQKKIPNKNKAKKLYQKKF